MPTEYLREEAERYLMNTYARQPLSIARGRGAKVYDFEGREYIDFVAGIAVNVLGHCHPDLVAAIQKQTQQLLHASNLYLTEPQVNLARELVSHTFADKVFFCNSGAEANETAIKLARSYAKKKFGPNRYEIITMVNSFHGRTMATLSATGQEKVQKGFEPLLPGFRHVPFNDLGEVEKAISGRTAAVMLEPIQGEGGVQVADPTYLQALREICSLQGVLVIFDEVQTGVGRTGTLFAYEQLGMVPDIMTVAKGLGGGMPIGACLAREDIAAAFTPGMHASTFGGNPIACSAALAVLKVLREGQVLEQGKRMGDYLEKGLKDIQAGLPYVVKDVRGCGLLRGMELTVDGGPIVTDCYRRGLLINCTMGRVLRFVPPLIISQAQIDMLLDALTQLLSARSKR